MDNTTLDGRPDRCWLHAKQATVAVGTPQRGADGRLAGPEDWRAASPSDAAAVTPREPQSREARVWLVNLNRKGAAQPQMSGRKISASVL